MATEILTDVRVKNLKPSPDKQYEVWDSKLPGFGVRVSPKGTKSMVLLYRIGRRSRRMTLGRYPVVRLAEARKLASAALRDVADGKDPATDKKQQHANPHAFDAFVDLFIEIHAKPKNRAWRENLRVLKNDFVRVWGKRDIRHIKKSDVISILDKLLADDKPSAANHAFAHIRKLFNWGVERGYIDASPCQGLKSPTQGKSRDRVLSDYELKAIWHGADQMAYPFGHLVQLLILTGQRRNEVASMRWEDLDLQKAVWSIPAFQMKSGVAHEVPLTPAALSVIQKIPMSSATYVFPARGTNNPVSGFSKWKKKLDSVSNTSDWQLHDIRRTVATGMARLKVPPHVVERVLNHTSGFQGGVAGVYNRFGYLDEMRDALDLWAGSIKRT